MGTDVEGAVETDQDKRANGTKEALKVAENEVGADEKTVTPLISKRNQTHTQEESSLCNG